MKVERPLGARKGFPRTLFLWGVFGLNKKKYTDTAGTTSAWSRSLVGCWWMGELREARAMIAQAEETGGKNTLPYLGLGVRAAERRGHPCNSACFPAG